MEDNIAKKEIVMLEKIRKKKLIFGKGESAVTEIWQYSDFKDKNVYFPSFQFKPRR
jgi:hypothetical protein